MSGPGRYRVVMLVGFIPEGMDWPPGQQYRIDSGTPVSGEMSREDIEGCMGEAMARAREPLLRALVKAKVLG